MRLSTRYGLAGIAALALLSLGHWLRGPGGRQPPPAGEYLIGILPNFAAAIAIAFVLLSIWADQNREATRSGAKRSFLLCASISALGLFGWEFVQKSSGRFVFDPHDLGATLVGIGVAGLSFHALTPRSDSPQQ